MFCLIILITTGCYQHHHAKSTDASVFVQIANRIGWSDTEAQERRKGMASAKILPAAVSKPVSVDFASEADEDKFTLHEGAFLDDVDGTRALRINMDGPHAKIPVNIAPLAMPTCSLCMWVKLASIPNARGWIVGNEETGYDRTILLHDNRFGGSVASAIGKEWRSNLGAPPLGQWFHVVAVFRQGGESYVFLNGRRSNIASKHTKNRPLGSREELWVGRPHHRDHFADCWIKSIAVVDYALSDEDVGAAHKGGFLAPLAVPGAGLPSTATSSTSKPAHSKPALAFNEERMLACLERVRLGYKTGRTDDAVAALRELGGARGTNDESDAFIAANGPRILLEHLRTCVPEDYDLIASALTNLASEPSLRQAARGDEADHDLRLANTFRIFTAVLTTIFALIFSGLVLFIIGFFLGNDEFMDDDGGNKHSKQGLSFFGWCFLLLFLLCVVGAYPVYGLFYLYESRFRSRLAQHDKQVEGFLENGTIRLLDVEWLRTTPLRTLVRCQDLPEVAFITPAAAKDLYRRRTREVGVLSYRWLRPEHPDPCGQRLAAMQALLRRTGLPIKALFWDFASLPQKGVSADGQILNRTPEEQERFGAGIMAMGSLYASLESTCVLQMKSVPPQPPEYDATKGAFNMLPCKIGTVDLALDRPRSRPFPAVALADRAHLAP